MTFLHSTRCCHKFGFVTSRLEQSAALTAGGAAPGGTPAPEGFQKTWIKRFTWKASDMNIWVLHWWLTALKMLGLPFEALSAYFRDRFAPHSTALNLLSAKAVWLQFPWNRGRSLQWRPGDAGTRSHSTARHTRCLSSAQPFKKIPVPALSEAEE